MKGTTQLEAAAEAWDGQLHQVPGFRTAALHCGLKTAADQPPDLTLLYCEQLAAVAGVFTQSRVCAAPVRLCRSHLKKSKHRARALVINAGNANACTGAKGEQDAQTMARRVAEGLAAPLEQVLVFSTGIIGRPMPMEKIERGIAAALQAVKAAVQTGDFARGIMTTDLVPKTAGVRLRIGGKRVHIAGACKGSGMIAPNMGTMLAAIVSDAAVAPGVLQHALSHVADDTFNCVTVDGDTSTNDSLALLASGVAGHKPISKTSGADYEAFCLGLHQVCDSLARQIAADGEGAQHTLTVYVGGTKNQVEARRIARTISESPLVKTAIAGNDPNWGRIIAAAGRAGVAFDPMDCVLTVCGHELFRAGQPTPFDKAKVAASLHDREVSIVLLVGDGPGRARFYSCDLTHGYITINADYHT